MQRILNIDIGKGHTKVKIGNKEFKFSTSVSFYGIGEFGAYSDVKTYEYKGKKFVVGESDDEDAIDTRGEGFLTEHCHVLIYHAIKLSGFPVSDFVAISTGISINEYAIKTEFENTIKKFKVNGETISFKRVLITEQGRGVLVDAGLEGEKSTVIDGGYLTLDAIPFNEQGKIDGRKILIEKYGVEKIVSMIRTSLNNKAGSSYTMLQVNELIKSNHISYGGVNFDLKEFKREASEIYVDELLTKLFGAIGEHLKQSKKVVFAGGLAYFLKDTPLAPNCVLVKNPEYSNVRGYSKIAIRKLTKKAA